MKKPILIFVLLVLTAGCAQKQQAPTAPIDPGRDTLFIHDSIFVPGDTLYVDTSRVDTVIIIRPGETDTVFVPVDTNGTSSFCGTIESATKTLTWLVSKPIGTYRLTFQVSTERDKPPQSVTVTIDGAATEWTVATQPTLVLNRLLGQSEIVISSNVPPARGHGITICLTIEASK